MAVDMYAMASTVSQSAADSAVLTQSAPSTATEVLTCVVLKMGSDEQRATA